jgi:hypothetical protein
MFKDVTLLAAGAHFAAFLCQQSAEHGLRYVVVTRDNRIAGAVRVNTSFRRGIEQSYSGVLLGDVAQQNLTIARESDIMFDVVERMTRHDADMAIVGPLKTAADACDGAALPEIESREMAQAASCQTRCFIPNVPVASATVYCISV